jgi:hypothetical protein
VPVCAWSRLSSDRTIRRLNGCSGAPGLTQTSSQYSTVHLKGRQGIATSVKQRKFSETERDERCQSPRYHATTKHSLEPHRFGYTRGIAQPNRSAVETTPFHQIVRPNRADIQGFSLPYLLSLERHRSSLCLYKVQPLLCLISAPTVAFRPFNQGSNCTIGRSFQSLHISSLVI